MVATQATPITGKNYPQVTPEMRLRLAQQRQQLMRQPERQAMPADLHRQEKYIFRAFPGTYRMIRHTLEFSPDFDAADHSKEGQRAMKNRRTWERYTAERFAKDDESPKDKATRDKIIARTEEYLQRVADELGDRHIVFARVPRATECYFATNSELVASYCRFLMDKKIGAFEEVYETSGNERVIVDGEAFPANEIGWIEARKMAREKGIDTIVIARD